MWTSTPWNQISSLSDDLELTAQGIKGIVPGAFENMDQLERLDLGRNELTEIKASTFRGLRRLRKLKLHGNEINEVAAGAFLGLHDLKHLDLSGNTPRASRTTNLRAGCFAGLGKLRELKLGFSYIDRFEAGVFEGLDSLKMMDLNGMQYGLGCVHAFAAGLSTTVVCSDGYGYEMTKPFFAPVNWMRDYATAVSYCTRLGGEIATVYSATENERARKACIESFKNAGGNDQEMVCFLGLEEVGGNVSTPKDDQDWRWHDGSEATYENWHPGEPSNSDYYQYTKVNNVEIQVDKRNAVIFCDDDGCNGKWRTFSPQCAYHSCISASALCRMY